MTYTQQLKNEVELYLKNLDEYEAVAPKALEILSRTAATMRENREQEICRTEEAIKEIAARKKRLHEIQEELKKAASDVRSSIKTYVSYSFTVLEQRTKKKRERLCESRKNDVAENEAQTQERYEKLLAVRQEYADEFAEISGDPNEVEKKLDEQAEQQGAKLTKLKTERGDGRLLPMLEGEEKDTVERFFDILPLVYIERSVLQREKYPNLLRLYALITRREEAAACAPDLEEGAVSVVCADAFMKLTAFIVMEQDDLRKGLWKSAFTVQPLQDFEIMFFANGEYSADLPGAGISWSSEILLMERGKLKDILKEIEEQPDADFPELVSRLSDLREPDVSSEKGADGFADIISRLAKPKNPKQEKFMKDFSEFTRLYRETPEERLVTEQRYYQQKLLEQAKEKNRLLQQQIDDEQERYEQEQREEERRYRREMKERAREREEQERAERERERARERAKREAMVQRQQEKRDTHKQCSNCANSPGCKMWGQRPNCSAYRPR